MENYNHRDLVQLCKKHNLSPCTGKGITKLALYKKLLDANIIESTSDNIEELPQDIIKYEILYNLDFQSVKKFCLTSKSVAKICNDTFWKNWSYNKGLEEKLYDFFNWSKNAYIYEESNPTTHSTKGDLFIIVVPNSKMVYGIGFVDKETAEIILDLMKGQMETSYKEYEPSKKSYYNRFENLRISRHEPSFEIIQIIPGTKRFLGLVFRKNKYSNEYKTISIADGNTLVEVKRNVNAKTTNKFYVDLAKLKIDLYDDKKLNSYISYGFFGEKVYEKYEKFTVWLG